jgi:hypothetical protein
MYLGLIIASAFTLNGETMLLELDAVKMAIEPFGKSYKVALRPKTQISPSLLDQLSTHVASSLTSVAVTDVLKVCVLMTLDP